MKDVAAGFNPSRKHIQVTHARATVPASQSATK